MTLSNASKFDSIDTLTLDLRDEMRRLESALKEMEKDRDEEVATRREIQRAADFNAKRFLRLDNLLDEILKQKSGDGDLVGLLSEIQKVREERA